MSINLKNYTTEVPATKSIENIEKLLIDFGASNIMKEIENAKVRSISFRVTIDNIPFAFKLPADVKSAYLWMKKKKPNSSDKVLLEQAERITWKYWHEWLHIQLTGIELTQLAKLQALLPHSFNPHTGESFLDKLKKGKFAALLTE